jgi:hypothetical protein
MPITAIAMELMKVVAYSAQGGETGVLWQCTFFLDRRSVFGRTSVLLWFLNGKSDMQVSCSFYRKPIFWSLSNYSSIKFPKISSPCSISPFAPFYDVIHVQLGQISIYDTVLRSSSLTKAHYCT